MNPQNTYRLGPPDRPGSGERDPLGHLDAKETPAAPHDPKASIDEAGGC